MAIMAIYNYKRDFIEMSILVISKTINIFENIYLFEFKNFLIIFR